MHSFIGFGRVDAIPHLLWLHARLPQCSVWLDCREGSCYNGIVARRRNHQRLHECFREHYKEKITNAKQNIQVWKCSYLSMKIVKFGTAWICIFICFKKQHISVDMLSNIQKKKNLYNCKLDQVCVFLLTIKVQNYIDGEFKMLHLLTL